MPRIYLDGTDNFLDIKVDDDDMLNLSIRVKNDPKKITLVSAKLDSEELDRLIAYMVSLKIKVRSGKDK